MTAKKRVPLWIPILGAVAAAAVLLYIFWWPVPADEAYELQLVTREMPLHIRLGADGSFSRDAGQIEYRLEPRTPLLKMRAARSFAETALAWSSSDPGVATVDADGRVTAVEKGSAQITLSYGALSESATVRVDYPLAGFTLSAHELVLEKKDRAQLALAPIPAQAELPENITFESLDEGVVKVQADGSVIPVEAGTTEVICRGPGGSEQELTDRCAVTVLPDVFPLEGIALKQDAFALNKGESAQIEILYTPENTTDDRTPTFTVTSLAEDPADSDSPDGNTGSASGNPAGDPAAILSVDSSGRITALAAGEALITVRVGAFEALCRVSVRVPMEGIRIERLPEGEPAPTPGEEPVVHSIPIEGGILSLTRGDAAKLTVIFLPEDTSDDRSVIWSSSDPSVATVEDGHVETLAGGTAVIRADCGDFHDEITLQVTVPATGLSLSRTWLGLAEGQSETLIARLLPADTTEWGRLSWSSSDPAIATVSTSGLVTALARGSCRIAVTCGAFSASCTVVVRDPSTGSDPSGDGVITVVLDAGHGVYWPGTTAVDGRLEKDLNMETMLACKWVLENYYSNIQVYITRYYDTPYYSPNSYVRADVRNRADWAASKGADLVVCLHYNSGGGGNGAMVFFATAANVTEASRALASAILYRITQLGFRDAGLRVRYLTETDEYGVAGEDHFSIIRNSAYHGIPAVLVEHCFVDNPDDYARLNIDDMGWADAAGIVDYLRNYCGLTVNER